MKAINILVVENELITAERIKSCLKKNGYQAMTVSSGEQAMELIRSGTPDIVLMDIHLDGSIDGITTAKSVNRLYSIPVIFITQLQDEEIFKAAKETFPKSYISKPFTDNTILHAIELALQQHAIQTDDAKFDHIESSLADRAFVQTSEGHYEKLLFTNILYIESDGSSAYIFSVPEQNKLLRSYHISLNSKQLIDKLQYSPLIKVQRSFYVNALRIEDIDDGKISLNGTEKKIPIGQEYKDELKRKFKFLKHNSSARK